MDNALYYLVLNRQASLLNELDVVANNVANTATSGFRREGLSFTEFVVHAGEGESVSMADLGARYVSERPGAFRLTGADLDLAIDGPGYFILDAEDGALLTRAGAFQVSDEGFIVTPNGQRVLDVSATPIFIPPDVQSLLIGNDGTISADGRPIGQIGVVDAERQLMSRQGNTAFRVEGEAFEFLNAPKIRQGGLEGANVDAITEISRLIEITRSYETIQALVEDEDERIRSSIRTMGNQG